jgi:hypothetical protein
VDEVLVNVDLFTAIDESLLELLAGISRSGRGATG